jgi:cytochrome b561
MNQNDQVRYSGVAKSLHWLILALLIVQFAIAWTMPQIGRGSVPTGLIGWHLSVGVAILAIMIVRLAWRITHPAPPAPTDLSPALAFLSRATHYLLYAVLIVLPLLGWANASSRGWAVKLFGIVPLPPLMAKGSPLGHSLGDIHGTLALILLAIIAVHVSGALYHALYLKDRTLQRMLP